MSHRDPYGAPHPSPADYDDIGVEDENDMGWMNDEEDPELDAVQRAESARADARASAQADAAVLLGMSRDGSGERYHAPAPAPSQYPIQREPVPPRRARTPPPPPVPQKVVLATPPPRARPVPGGMKACVCGMLRVVYECLAGVWELARVAVEALRDALRIDPMFKPRVNSPESSAVQGQLLVLVMAQVLVLGVQVGLLTAVGLSGTFADVVHMGFVATQVAALAAVPLGVYVYVFGGVDPSSRGGSHVYTLYMVCELAKACGDAACAVRLGLAYDDAHHVAAILAPDHVLTADAWDHGACGQPHAVAGVLFCTAALGAALSGLNVVSLLGQHREKVKAGDDAPDDSAVSVNMAPEPPPRDPDPPKRRKLTRSARIASEQHQVASPIHLPQSHSPMPRTHTNTPPTRNTPPQRPDMHMTPSFKNAFVAMLEHAE